jgi:hypothetical protein
MLVTLARKICPLMTLVLATVSCGKKIHESKADTASTTTESSEPTSAFYSLKLDSAQNIRKQFVMKSWARFQIPDRLYVRAGSSAGKMVEVAYNVDEYDDQYFQFKCFYSPSRVSSEMSLTRCEGYDADEDFGDVSDEIFGLRQGEIIQMRFTGAPANGLAVELLYKMEWI